MKRKNFSALVLMGLLTCVGTMMSCSDDDAPGLPGLELTDIVSTGKAGDEVSIAVSVTTDAAFETLVITKQYDGAAQGTETLTELTANEFTYTYTIIEDDADQILTFNFFLTDAAGQEISQDWVITVELTAQQLLLKHNWRLNDEIRQKNSMSDINTVYQDDVYQFNSDGTYQKNNAGTLDDFNDSWYNFCFYDVNNTTLRLLMSRTGAFEEDVVDTLNITLINDTQLSGNTTYYGLDAFNTGSEDVPYEAVEDYERQFVAVSKTGTFDPYGPGADDDAGPGATCIEKEFDN